MKLEILTDEISHIISHRVSPYSAAGNKWLVARAKSNTILEGEVYDVKLNYPYKFFGVNIDASQNTSRYPGSKFRFSFIEPFIDDTKDGYIGYLCKFVPGIGDSTANKLYDAFGSDLIDVCASQVERLNGIDGISKSTINKIRDYFSIPENDPFTIRAHGRLKELFSEYGISDKIILKLVESYGSGAVDFIKDKPYKLLDFKGVGWVTGDRFAIGKIGIPRDSLDRQKAAIIESFDFISTQGHTCAYRDKVNAEAYQRLDYIPSQDAWAALIGKEIIQSKDDDKLYSLFKHDYNENCIARRLIEIEQDARPLPISVDEVAGDPESESYLSEKQRRGVQLIIDHGVAVLSGSPGAGKTLTVTKIITKLPSLGISVIFITPTGKAAKRGAELLERHAPGCEIPCSTIHRALGVQGSEEDSGIPTKHARIGRGRNEFGFFHNEQNPLPYDVIVVDECSLLDTSLASALFRAIKPGARLILVGDHNQLPSVGPGSVLRDALLGGVPHVILDEIRRSAGAVVRACHAIKDGKVPKPCTELDWVNGANWRHIEAGTQQEIAQHIENIFISAIKQKNNSDNVEHPFWKDHTPFWDIQVVTIQNEKIPVSCDALNARLSKVLNPDLSEETVKRNGFSIGDKIIRVRNGTCDQFMSDEEWWENSQDSKSGPDHTVWCGARYAVGEAAVVNGDMGIVLDFVSGKGERPYVIVRFNFPERLCRLPLASCELKLAYAITAHKSQGSGFPYVIIPIHNSFYFDEKTKQGLYTREWLYTALSRTETICVTVGQESAIAKSVGRKTVFDRRTQLATLIKRKINESHNET